MKNLARCNKCSSCLTNVVERPMSPKLVGTTHLLGGAFIQTFAVATVMGECMVHGLVRVEKKEDRTN